MDILVKDLGPEAKVKVVIEQGKLKLVADLDTKGVDAQVSMAVDSDYFIDELAKKIPGTLDDAILNILKMALKSL